MLKFNRILVGRDFSPCSDRAFQYALEFAARSGAQVYTVFAEVIHGPSAPPPSERASGGELARRHVVREDVVRDAAAAPAILDYAHEHEVDLIVLGTHGRRGLRRLFLGSVAEEVVRLSECPVLTVHDNAADPRDMFRDILVPIDFSEYSEAALQQAIAIASEFGAALDLLHVVEEPLHPAFYNTGVFSIYDIQPDVEVRAEEHLKKLAQASAPEGLEVRYHVRPGHAAREIVAFAEERRSGLIVMATHGLTGIEHLLIGSVAEKVTRMAPCPVFTAKRSRTHVEPPSVMKSGSSGVPA